MNRQLPKLADRPVTAFAVFEPNGKHLLEVYVPRIGVDMPLTIDEVHQLEAKIDAFKRASAFEDGRTVERTNRHREAL